MLTPSPICQAIAAAVVGADDRGISSITVVAPLSHGPARLLVTWAGMDHEVSTAPDTDGITCLAWTKPADHVAPIPPLTAPEATVIQSAWAWGAWDISRTCIGPGYSGPMPWDWAGADELRRQGWVTWTFRPMLGGPDIRAKAHGSSDATLNPITLGRHQAMPDVRPPPIRPGSQHVIRLGRSPQTAPARQEKRIPKATPKQIGLIRHLRRETGETSSDDPVQLNIREASAEIKRLLALQGSERL